MKGPSVLVTELRGVDNASGVYKKVGRAAADLQRSMDGMAGKLFDQVNAARMSTKEFDLYKASLMGLGRAEKQRISDMHDLISAEKQQTAAAAEQARQAQLEAQLSEKREKNIQQVIQLLERERDMLKYNTRELHLRMAAQNGASEAQIRHINNLHDGIDAMSKTEKGGRNLNGTLRLMRGGFGQVGHQIQDIAVQLQMGTNAMLVFGQQGGQIASLFGPKGAIIGAVLSVGAAVGTYLASSMGNGEKAIKEMAETAKQAASDLTVLTQATREFLAVQNAKEIKAQRDEVDKQNRIIEEATNAQQSYRDALQAASRGMATREQRLLILNSTEEEFKETIVTANYALEEANKQLEDLTGKSQTLAAGGNPYSKQTDGVKELKGELEDINRVIDEFKESQLSPEQLIDKRFYDSMNAISEASNQGVIDASEASRMIIDLNRKRASDLAEIRRQEANEQLQIGMDEINETLRRTKESHRERIEATREFLQQQKEAERKAAQERIEAKRAENEEIARVKGLERDLSQLKSSLMSEEELFAQSMAKRYAMLETFRAEQLVSETEYLAMRRALQEQEVEKQLDDQLRLINGFEGMKRIGVDAISAVIKEGASMSDVFKMIGRTIVDNVIESFVDMGVEYVKQALVRQAIEKKGLGMTIATSVAAGKTMAAAYAPAAAMASLASFGGNAVPAQTGMATTVGVARTLASFEGGGFTGTGSRSGGIDGRGGFLSVLHPNETVIDHTKGQGQGITIVNNIDASGAGPEVDQKIVAAMEVTSQQTVKQVQDLLRRQRLV